MVSGADQGGGSGFVVEYLNRYTDIPRFTCVVGRIQSAAVVVYVCVSSGGYGIRSGSRGVGGGFVVEYLNRYTDIPRFTCVVGRTQSAAVVVYVCLQWQIWYQKRNKGGGRWLGC